MSSEINDPKCPERNLGNQTKAKGARKPLRKINWKTITRAARKQKDRC